MQCTIPVLTMPQKGYTLLMNSLCKALRLALLAGFAVAQQPQTGAAPLDKNALTVLVKQQFGATFSLPEKFPTPLITADFDGDGIEDVAIVADSKEPIPDSFNFKYQIGDPYNSYFGLGDPNISSTFSTGERTQHSILVIFGAGPEGWRSATPKAKFVLINIPFDNITTGRIMVKKNKAPVFVIRVVESEIMDSNVFWDAKRKKWHWEPGQMAN